LVYLYSNEACDEQAMEGELAAAKAAGIEVAEGCAVHECEAPAMPALERPALATLVQRVRPGDAVYMLHLSCLGCHARDMLATIARFRKAGAALHCLQTGRADLTRRGSPPAVSMLRALVALESRVRSARAQQSAAIAREMGTHLGRKPKLSESERRNVALCLAGGESVSEVARRFNVSRQTVLRVRDADVADMAELPDLPHETAGDWAADDRAAEG